jgi:hypothetical protein
MRPFELGRANALDPERPIREADIVLRLIRSDHQGALIELLLGRSVIGNDWTAAQTVAPLNQLIQGNRLSVYRRRRPSS